MKLKGHFKQNELFYKDLWIIALPIALQQLVTSSLNMVDTLMVGKVGVDAVAAVGVSNQYYFLLNMVMFGIYSGGMVYFAQFWGKKDIRNIHRLLGFTLLLGIGLAAIFTGLALFIPEQIISIFTDDVAVQALGANYLRVASLSYPFMILSFGFSMGLRAVEKPKFSMIASVIALTLNTILNLVLIFGLFGCPALGVLGAAVATLVSRIVEFILVLGLAYLKTDTMNPKLSVLLSFDKELINKLMVTSLPVVINECFWGLGTTAYMVIYGMINVESISIMNIVNSIFNIFFIAAIGVGNASTVMLGKQLGAGEKEKTYKNAILFLKVGIVLGIISGLLLVACIPVMLQLYNDFDAQTLSLMAQVLVVFAVGLTFRFINIINIVGVFRAGGDTKYAMILELGVLWIVGVLGTFIAVKFFNAPLLIVAIIVQLEEVVKTIIGMFRVHSKKWINQLV
ncbi:MAG: MATE family efflux transporter [Turicibacter sp.]|nr:MATE family efflux transporter [Turicibacter sp.]MEE0880624.1 MATE family efflux transporter [Turicibacter sp.]